MRKIINVTLIILLIGIILTILFNQNIINSLQNRIQENIDASNLETQTNYKVIEEKDNTLYVLLTMENQKGIEKITTPDGTINCYGKKKVSIDRELEEGTNYSIRLKLQGETREELHTYIATTKPKMKVIDYDTLGDGTTRTVEINYPNIANVTNYYSLDNGETWQVYTEPIQVEDTNKENVLAKIEWNEGKTINKPVNYRDCIDIILFGEVTWSNGKANIEISSVNKENIEYQINGTDGTWQKGYTVTNLNHNDIIYARVSDGTYIMDEKNTTIQDTTEPNKVEITIDKVKYNFVTVTVDAIDKETGIKDYTYVLEENDDNKIELTNITETTKKITGLTEQTTYKVYVIAYDNAGNKRKSNVVTITTPEKNITPIATSEYGKSVNYTANGISDWKVFYVDNDIKLADGVTDNPYYGCTYIIISGYLPVGKLPSGTQLSTSSTHAFYFNFYNIAYHNIIDTDVSIRKRFKMSWNKNTTNYNIKATSQLLNTSVWKSFAEGTIDSNGTKLEDAYAIGSPTLEMWVESWNDAGYTKLYCNKQDNNGYYIGTTSSPSTTSQSLTSSKLSKTGWPGDKLYFPYPTTSGYGGAHGYVLASLYASPSSVSYVSCGYNANKGGDLSATYFMSSSREALRPIVCLPPDAKLTLNPATGLYDITQ